MNRFIHAGPALREDNFLGADAEKAALLVQHGATGVARSHERVCLDDETTLAPQQGGDGAGRDPGLAVGKPDNPDPTIHQKTFLRRNLDGLNRGGGHQHGQITDRIAMQNPGWMKSSAWAGTDLNFGSSRDHVLIGDDPSRGNDHTGAHAKPGTARRRCLHLNH